MHLLRGRESLSSTGLWFSTETRQPGLLRCALVCDLRDLFSYKSLINSASSKGRWELENEVINGKGRSQSEYWIHWDYFCTALWQTLLVAL